MAHIESSETEPDPLRVALRAALTKSMTTELTKALGSYDTTVQVAAANAAVDAAITALSDPDVTRALAGSLLKSAPVMAKITELSKTYTQEIFEKKRKEDDAFVSDMKARLDVVEKAARVTQPAIRPQAEPNPMGQHYRRLAQQTDDRALRAGYEQLAGEHDIRGLN